MEGLGQKFQQARAARNLTLEEAARMTKIRPSKLAEIEAEDFSQFPSLAYAKGFLLIYGKFLNVDVTPYLEAFETSEHVTVDGYSYLQDNPVPPPRRTEVVRHRAPSGGGGGGGGGRKTSLLPLVIGVVVLVAGFSLLRLMMDVRRLPSHQRDAQALAQASPTVPPANAATAPPQALPVDPTASPGAPALAAASPAPAAQPGSTAPAAIPSPAPEATIVAAATPGTTPEEEPEVRRAEPVNPEDLVKAEAALAKSSPSPGVNRFDIRPLRKTFVRVIVDGATGPAIERWLNVSEAPVQLRGQRIAVKVLDPGAVEIRKNGKIVARGDADIRLE